MNRVLIFDTETTDRKEGEIIEAAWLAIAPVQDLLGSNDDIDPELRIGSMYIERFKPSSQISFGAMAVHHILPSELERSRPSAEFALPSQCEYLIGQSIDFDWTAAGAPAHVKRIDTHAIAQWLWPDATGYSQGALLYMLEGASEQTRTVVLGAHSALADVHLNLLLLRHILKLKLEIRTWSQLWDYSQQCRIPRTCPLKKYEGVLLEDLDAGFIDWCLRQHWLDQYFRIGLEQVLQKRYPRQSEYEEDYA